MKNLVKPWWIFVVNTFPLIILFCIWRSDFQIIKSLLSPESIKIWYIFAAILGVYFVLNLSYGICLTVKKRTISLWYAITALVISIAIIYSYMLNSSEIIPFNIPQWMIPGDRYVYLGTFLMPTIAYLIFVMVVKLTDVNKRFTTMISFGISIAIPVLFYLFFTLLVPLWHRVTLPYEEHVFVVTLITFTTAFLFFLIRSIYSLVAKRSDTLAKKNLIWKIPLVLILPVVGLLVNNSFDIFKIGLNSERGVFGNFNNIWFYIIAVLNGILLLLPSVKRPVYRVVLLTGRMATAAFSFYFFVTFIPFLPFSVVAIVFLGAGFLMLSPIAMFIIHLDTIIRDFRYLKGIFNTKKLYLTFIALFIIPATIVLTFYQDKVVLNRALNYVYNPDYNKGYEVKRKPLRRSLNSIKRSKKFRRDTFDNNYSTPYISSLYSRIVLDNLTLSDNKINYIERIFFNAANEHSSSSFVDEKVVSITDIQVESSYDQSKGAYISTVHFELTNSVETWLREYNTTFKLPEGCWISDYYLDVFGVRKSGLLTEKKSAMWIYSQIKNRDRRDPGILHYLTGRRIRFSVFPFADKEVRKSGIEFMHREPVEVVIDGYKLKLGSDKVNKIYETSDNVTFVSSDDKAKLDVVKREPYYHFIVDVSEGMEGKKQEYVKRIKKLLLENNLSGTKDHKVSFTNSYVKTYTLDSNLESIYPGTDYKGGFFLNRAIQEVLVDSYKNVTSTYPVIVVLTDYMISAIIEDDFSDIKAAYPEGDYFYYLNSKNELESYNLFESPITKSATKATFNSTVLAFPDKFNPIAYLRDDNKSEVVILNRDITEFNDNFSKDFSSGLELERLWFLQNIYPEKSDDNWNKLVKGSFKSGIMTSLTSYIVVENEAQEKMLLKKQNSVMKGNKNLDLETEPRSMSEPGLLFLAVILLLYKLNSLIKRRKITI